MMYKMFMPILISPKSFLTKKTMKNKLRQRRKSFFKKFSINVTKRQKFVIAVTILSSILFLGEHFLGRSGFVIAVILSILTDILLIWSNKKDIGENFSWAIFILPFFYSLAFGLFYFLIPARFLTRIFSTLFYAVGLYSLFLAENIFIVASARTIALLSSAQTVSFIISIISFFFLSNIVFSFHLSIIPTVLALFPFTFFLILFCLWTITLEKLIRNYVLWSLTLTLGLMEIALLLWFWPSNPTLIAIFLTGVFYTTVGLSQVWLSKRLFKGVMWEYLWMVFIVFSVFILFTSWR